MSEIETQNTINIVCPYCGNIDFDSWSYDYDYDHNHKCEICGKTFSWCREIVYCSWMA